MISLNTKVNYFNIKALLKFNFGFIGIIGIYGLVVAMVLNSKISSVKNGYTLTKGFAHLAAGLTCGLCGLGAGYAIGIVGDAGVRGTAQQPRLFVGMILILIFSEVCLFFLNRKMI